MKACIILFVLVFGLAPTIARSDTPCGGVSTVISVLNPTITGAPKPVKLATYDLNTKGLSIQYANNRADYLVGVPSQVIVGHATVPWASIARYPTALVQDRSTCPVLSSAGTPILTSSNAFPTVTPFVRSPCPADTGTDPIQLVSLVQAPLSIYRAVYDRKLLWLFVQFADGESVMFVGVPAAAVRATVIWNDLSIYGAAIMSQGVGTTCPLLAQP